jgi:3-oxoacyl-[acyl-carrier protein] reductase
MSFKDKVAIVSGSTSGVGKAVAEKLANEGVKIIVTGLDKQNGKDITDTIITNGGEAAYINVNLMDLGSPNILVEKAIEKWNQLDFVVNCAALICNKEIEAVTHDDWDRLFAINLKAPFFLIQAALPWLKQSKGSVINISSINALINSPNNVVYDTLKAALSHMTRGLALDLKEFGIRFNSIMPAGIATPLLENWFEMSGATFNCSEVKNDNTIASPEMIANVVVHLGG